MNSRKVLSPVLLLLCLLLAAAGCVGEKPAPQPPAAQAKPSRAALDNLMRGNERFMAFKLAHPNTNKNVRETTAIEGQYPQALVLACSDSRVPVETIFDQGIGDLFVVRVAGNVTSPEVLGSIQYGVHHLQIPLVVVLGHTSCGAVKSACGGGHAEGTLGQLLSSLQKIHARVEVEYKGLSPDRIKSIVTEANIKQAMQDVMHDNHELAGLAENGDFIIKGAVYDIHSGRVNWLD